METIYSVLDIIRGTTVDGPGFRTAVYLAGCSHQCQACHNPQSWNPHEGREMDIDEIMQIVKEEDFDVTLTGGDPLFNPESTRLLIKMLKENNRNVWIYTGYTWEEIMEKLELFEAIKEADVIVDGRFDISLRDPDLRFRGSSNQRIIDIKKSAECGRPVLW